MAGVPPPPLMPGGVEDPAGSLDHHPLQDLPDAALPVCFGPRRGNTFCAAVLWTGFFLRKVAPPPPRGLGFGGQCYCTPPPPGTKGAGGPEVAILEKEMASAVWINHCKFAVSKYFPFCVFNQNKHFVLSSLCLAGSFF